MRIPILATLAVGCGAFALGGTEASATIVWYRANDPVVVQSPCAKGPRWNYSAAYYDRRAYYGARPCRQARGVDRLEPIQQHNSGRPMSPSGYAR